MILISFARLLLQMWFSFMKSEVLLILSVFSYGSSSISMIFVFWWITLNEYITREWQIYIIFQSNDLDS